MERIALHAALLVISAASVAAPMPAIASGTQASRPDGQDIADRVAGTYYGDVISDARGSSRSGVTITVTRVGANLVEVSSDYARIPTVRIPIERAMSAIVQANGDHVFLIDEGGDPDGLTLTIDGASLSVRRQSAPK
ncbi:hypothetical protein RCO27_01420 [Sphingosinicella sp. LHD-64]|uniref:hypothetical protein n=1 Tax=Sphingosinicella sp. LHD-64 TaxID=3072139 RepID=UPI00280F8FAD|nr:hypothetical protein [Sphingosinicella sp. LHD-64]MDQ8754876.1 hypothetical protein [Sphingosinicella sp. LHD-64]